MNTGRHNYDLAQAVDLFVMTKFRDCFEECKEVIASAKMEAEQERNDEIIEAATALGIQALAETDRWLDTTAFVTSVYGSVDLCPPRIVQVCILLHAHVREFLRCHGMVQAWLKNPQNLILKQCGQVIRIYATHVLCPTGCRNMVKEIVDRCVSLTQTEKTTLLEQSLSQASPNDGNSHCLSTNPTHSEGSSICTNHHDLEFDGFPSSSTSMPSPDQDVQDNSFHEIGVQDPISWFQTNALAGCRKVCQILTENFRFLRNPSVQLFFMGMMAVLALMQTQTGDVVSSLGRFVILWRTFVKRVFVHLKLKKS